MSYTSKLNELINNSGMSLKDIAIHCNDYGLNITSTYIGLLRKGEGRKSSDEVSRVLAKVLNAPSSETLVIENYIDKAPEIIKQYFENTKQFVIPYITDYLFTNDLTVDEYTELAKSINISDLIIANANTNIEQVRKNINSIKITTVDDDEITMTSKVEGQPIAKGLMVDDDGMSPTVQKGDRVQIEVKEKYEFPDIVYFTVLKTKKNLCRNFIQDNKGNIITMPINNQYKKITYKPKDIRILGKVKVINRTLK